ncbi:ornithine cyclodeaminase family protein [Cytobacillus sp. FSL K6-0265]|uniref:ornithine cyclodeaminase family protein n=1 Tax=Cytobacillus sp. FSL K6-0265 TaxID=2921448 RepID=UPI0030FACBE3
MLVLSEKEIKTLYVMKDAIEDMETALVAYHQGKITSPQRTVLDIPEKKASALYMPSAMETMKKAAVKIVTIFPENPKEGLKTTQGVILLSDTENGTHVACLNASYLTRLRTGALSGVATKYLAKKEARSVAVLGCGAMAEEQLQAVCEVRNIDHIYLYNRTRERAERFAKRMREILPNYKGKVEVVADPDDAVKQSDIVNCSTRAVEPIFKGSSLQQGAHINGIGSYLPNMREVDVETLKRASKVVADTIEGVKEEAGDFIIPNEKGDWHFDELHGELTELAAHTIMGRESDEEITFFKSVGAAYFDLAAAAAVYDKAKKQGIGTEVEV